mmetsp:Transcript_63468/g.127292  ORF Transcript_63468/g.127292 Transcript_63468/m.127292 type:complete len:243 (-) Transcript_63468:14-742(-)
MAWRCRKLGPYVEGSSRVDLPVVWRYHPLDWRGACHRQRSQLELEARRWNLRGYPSRRWSRVGGCVLLQMPRGPCDHPVRPHPWVSTPSALRHSCRDANAQPARRVGSDLPTRRKLGGSIQGARRVHSGHVHRIAWVRQGRGCTDCGANSSGRVDQCRWIGCHILRLHPRGPCMLQDCHGRALQHRCLCRTSRERGWMCCRRQRRRGRCQQPRSSCLVGEPCCRCICDVRRKKKKKKKKKKY